MNALEYTDYVIKDNNLMRLAVDFVSRWKQLQYLLEKHGYIASNFNTFCVAQAMIKTSKKSGVYAKLEQTENVDKHSLEKISELTRTNRITYLAMDYPALGNFKCFYFKERNERVSKIVESTIGKTYNTRIGSFSIQEVLDALSQAQMLSTGAEREEALDNEIELMSGVSEFINSCEGKMMEVGRIFDSHNNKLDEEMIMNSRKMVAHDYELWKKGRIGSVASLSERYEHLIMMCMNQIHN